MSFFECYAKKSGGTVLWPVTESKSTRSEQLLDLTYWVAFDSKADQALKDYSEMTTYQDIEKATNIRIVFKHPSVGQERG